MNFNDEKVLDILNNYITTNRLSKRQILEIIQLVQISNDFKELKESFEWENL